MTTQDPIAVALVPAFAVTSCGAEPDTDARCDQYNCLYDAEGTILCAPAGGIAGSGDGQCPGVL